MNQDIDNGAADGQLNVYAEIADWEGSRGRTLSLVERAAFVMGFNAARRNTERWLAAQLALDPARMVCQECDAHTTGLGLCDDCDRLAYELQNVVPGTGPTLVRDYITMLERHTGRAYTGAEAYAYYREHGVDFGTAAAQGAERSREFVLQLAPVCQCGLPEDAETHDESLIGRVSSAHELMLRDVSLTAAEEADIRRAKTDELMLSAAQDAAEAGR